MGALSGILALVGTGTSVYGQYSAGQNAADVYKYNQNLAQYQAKYIQEKADVEVQNLERDVAQYIGRQRAIQGKSGTVAGEGSNYASLLQTKKEAAIDAAIIRYNADIGSWAANAEASLLGTGASQFNTASYLNSGGTLLGGLSKWDWKNYDLKTSTSPSLTNRQMRLGV